MRNLRLKTQDPRLKSPRSPALRLGSWVFLMSCVLSGLALAGVDTLEAPMVSNAPAIDGTIGESEWMPALKTEITPKTGSWDFGKTEVSYIFYVMYDENYLYVAARLTDDDIQTDSAAEGSINGQTWQDDSIEIFVDGNHNHAPNAFVDVEYQFGGQYVITAGNAIRFQNSGAKSFGDGVDDDYYAVADIKDQKHWEMEARLQLSLFGSPRQGDIVGFNISTNDDDGGGGEEAALFWTGDPPDIYKNEQVWGDLVFGELFEVSPASKLATTWGHIRRAGIPPARKETK